MLVGSGITKRTTEMLIETIRQAVGERLQDLVAEDGFKSYSGKYTDALRQQLIELYGAKSALLVSSGTVALEIALRGMGIGPGDLVALSAYDYPGNFWAIERVGARPVLIDTQADSWRLDLNQLKRFRKQPDGQACKAVIASHLYGELHDSASIRKFCDEHSLWYVEDACQVIGAEATTGGFVGQQGHATILSFGGGKLISAGRGGCLLTADDALGQRQQIAAGAGSGPTAMSELQACVVQAQLEFLGQINASCRKFFSELNQRLTAGGDAEPNDSVPARWVMPAESQLDRTSFYQAGWLIQSDNDVHTSGDGSADKDEKASSVDRLPDVISQLNDQGIRAGTGFGGFHRRSQRRCDVPYALVQTPLTVERTLVIHHQVALEGRHSTQAIADLVQRALN